MSLLTVKFFQSNTFGRDFVVGDLHGCFSAFQALLDHVKFHPGRDRIFCVGDLIDRGPQSLETLALLKTPWFFSCLGNHEQMLINYLRAPHRFEPYDTSWLSRNLRTFTDRQYFAGQWLSSLERLPLVMAVGSGRDKFYVVHAEILDKNKTVIEKALDVWDFVDPERAIAHALEGRSLIKAYQSGKPIRRAHDEKLPMIYCGHTIVDEPMVLARQTYLDGGAYTIFKTREKASKEPTKWLEMEKPRLRMMDVKSGVCYAADPQTANVEIQHILKPVTL